MVPICYASIPPAVLRGLPLYLRTVEPGGAERFTLYAAAGLNFSEDHRDRLREVGVRFVYIPDTQQELFRRRLEDAIESLADDRAIALPTRCEMVYESGLELIGEMLATRDMEIAVPRLRRVAKSIVSLHLNDPRSFRHFFDAAHHDGYPATHAGNTATWLPALAMARGERCPETLVNLCMGGLLYDVGMSHLPSSILNKQGKLSPGEWQQVRQHTEIGAQLLRQYRDIDPVLAIIAQQHHERLDGSGYPRGLRAEQIHPAARMMAVIDTFDALTSFRPYRDRGMSARDALEVLRRESPEHFDSTAVEDWSKLLLETCPEILQDGASAMVPAADDSQGRRRFPRYMVKCRAKLHVLKLVEGFWLETGGTVAVVDNLSRGGVMVLSQSRLQLGSYVRAKLQGKDGVTRILNAMVVRTHECGDGWYEIGGKFVDLAREAAPPDGSANR